MTLGIKIYIVGKLFFKMEDKYMSQKLDKIEEEIVKLKVLLAVALHTKKKKKLASLKGILNNIDIKDEDVEEAKKSLFKIEK